MSESRILFYDPNPGDHHLVIDHLQKMGLSPIVCDTADMLDRLHDQDLRIELALLGATRPNGHFSQTVTRLRQLDPEIVMICATESTCAPDETLAAGADEIIVRPYVLPQVEGAVRMALELRRLREEARRLRGLLEKRQTFHGLIGGSEPMMALYRYLEQIARSTAPVLIDSEPGTEIHETVLAIHRCSQQPEGMIKRFDASYLDASDLTAFLRQSTIGEPGILWIDNIERLDAYAQETLLNLLSGEGNPGGWRLITSSDHDLKAAVESGHFRRDLFYRINVFTVRIPPLRERLEDLPLLAADRLRSKGRFGMPGKRLGYRALLAVSAHGWPRNVAEFESALRVAAERTAGEVIEPAALPASVGSHAGHAGLFSAEHSLREAKAQFELEYYRNLLTRTRGNMSAASKISKVGRPYLYKKIRECNLDPESFRGLS